MRKDLRIGQSILEYTLLLAAIIALIVLVTFRQGGIKDKVQDIYNKTGDALNKTAGDLSGGIFQ